MTESSSEPRVQDREPQPLGWNRERRDEVREWTKLLYAAELELERIVKRALQELGAEVVEPEVTNKQEAFVLVGRLWRARRAS